MCFNERAHTSQTLSIPNRCKMCACIYATLCIFNEYSIEASIQSPHKTLYALFCAVSSVLLLSIHSMCSQLFFIIVWLPLFLTFDGVFSVCVCVSVWIKCLSDWVEMRHTTCRLRWTQYHSTDRIQFQHIITTQHTNTKQSIWFTMKNDFILNLCYVSIIHIFINIYLIGVIAIVYVCDWEWMNLCCDSAHSLIVHFATHYTHTNEQTLIYRCVVGKMVNIQRNEWNGVSVVSHTGSTVYIA